MAKRNRIQCPHCGYEYLAAEIYYPDRFLGRPADIIRDETGAILGFRGSDIDMTEQFYCIKCDKLFSVDATITFKAVPIVDMFADDDDFSSIKKSK